MHAGLLVGEEELMCLWAHTIIYCIYGDVQHYCLDAHSALRAVCVATHNGLFLTSGIIKMH